MASPSDPLKKVNALPSTFAEMPAFEDDTQGLPVDDEPSRTGDLIGESIGKYRIISQMGSGGMGVVYEAIHESIGQRAAIKALRTHLSQDPEFAERFFNEARAATIAQHASLVKNFDFGQTASGGLYILMEFLEGESLRQRLRRCKRLSQSESLRLTRQIASAMAYVHTKGIFHRDLKPDNVIIVRDTEAVGKERAKILDFGLAKIQSTAAENLSHDVGSAVVGTPAYMSPEQCRGLSQADGPADVYALGVMLYEMLAGRLPFESQTPGDLLIRHIEEEPPPLSRFAPEVPPELVALTHELLRKVPEARPSMQQVEATLSEIERVHMLHDSSSESRQHLIRTIDLERPPPRRAPIPLWLASLLMSALVTASGLYLLRKLFWTGNATRAADPSTQMVSLAAGVFTMGSSADETSAAYFWCQQVSLTACPRETFEREQPARRVAISEFRLDATEVTNQQFAAWLNQHKNIGDYALDKADLVDRRWPDERKG